MSNDSSAAPDTPLSLPEGTRVEFLSSLERYPHFRIPPGARGAVSENSPDLLSVRMDDVHPGLAPWDNEVLFTPADFPDARALLRPLTATWVHPPGCL